MKKQNKELLFSLTKKDFRWDYYVGHGKGGQKRNKTENCCRCTHVLSGAVGKSEEGRSKDKNTKRAFKRMFETKEFQDWLRIEVSRVSGQLELINKKIEKELKNIIVEYKEHGKWVKVN